MHLISDLDCVIMINFSIILCGNSKQLLVLHSFYKRKKKHDHKLQKLKNKINKRHTVTAKLDTRKREAENREDQISKYIYKNYQQKRINKTTKTLFYQTNKQCVIKIDNILKKS